MTTRRTARTRLRSRRVRASSCAVLALPIFALGTAFAPGGAVADDSSTNCPEPQSGVYLDDAVDGTSAVACDLVGEVVSTDDAALQIPSPGHTIVLTEIYEDDEEVNAQVAVSTSGVIDVEEEPPTTPRVGGTGDPLGPCQDETYNLIGPKWYTTSAWGINRGSIPTPNLQVDNTVAALRDAIQNITGADNDCGMVDNLSAAGSYQGDTDRTGTIGYDVYGRSTCGAFNDHSTVYFGDRQPGVLATTCFDTVAHDGRNKLVEADIEIDKTERRWTTVGGSSSCDSEYDLESIITHEFGHWFGMNHTYTSVALTMYKSAPSKCTTAWRSLGRGDVLGLRQLY